MEYNKVWYGPRFDEVTRTRTSTIATELRASHSLELEGDNDNVVEGGNQKFGHFQTPFAYDASKHLSDSKLFDQTHQSINRFSPSEIRKPRNDADVFFELTLQKSRGFKLADFLRQHEITEKYRAKMMDWMVEVLSVAKQKEDTLFKVFLVMDMFFQNCKTRIPCESLHLIGSVCIMIASKHEEKNTISLDSLISSICRNKFSKEEILEAEVQILSVIGFRVHLPTVFELSRCAFNLLEFDDAEVREFFQKGSLLISKMCLFSYEMVNSYSFEEITAFSIILSLKLAESFKGGVTSQFNVL
jgi:hypothetical protein